jgi:molybdopterin/thiamine biosynthesis adenylyltransferase
VNDLLAYLRDGAQGDLLPWAVQLEATRRFDLSFARVEAEALRADLLPLRYTRNRSTISTAGQRRLFGSRVVVIGCGGLGGYLVEQLARLGVGALDLVDPDVFEEHNLNRQLLSSPGLLGHAKVDAGRRRVAEINPAVTVRAHQLAFTRENGPELLAGADAVADGLDNLPARRDLAVACRELRVPLVHGAIGGWCGQVATQLPDVDIAPLLGVPGGDGKGVERTLGNPAFTPAVVASIQVAELAKVLLGQGRPLSGRALFLDLHEMVFEVFGHG